MNMDERIKRINELYHKSQNEGLTDEEKLEQTILRQEYVDSIKRNMKAQLDNIEIERPDGTIEKLKPAYKKKNDQRTEKTDSKKSACLQKCAYRTGAGTGEAADHGADSWTPVVLSVGYDFRFCKLRQ